MQWQTPEFTEINMSAEIGGYQDEFEDRIPPPSRVKEPVISPPEIDE